MRINNVRPATEGVTLAEEDWADPVPVVRKKHPSPRAENELPRTTQKPSEVPMPNAS